MAGYVYILKCYYESEQHSTIVMATGATPDAMQSEVDDHVAELRKQGYTMVVDEPKYDVDGNKLICCDILGPDGYKDQITYEFSRIKYFK